MSVEIKDVVEEFVKDNKLFTSVDIANKIKDDGEWISNRFVSKEINYLFNLGEYPDYKKSTIQVERAEDKVIVNAILYMPETACETDYKNTNAIPITPTVFDHYHSVIDLDIETDDKENDMIDNVKDEDKKVVKDTKTFTKSKRNYRKFNFL